jgi:DNA (cytosine-5)-methyltransferase 1
MKYLSLFTGIGGFELGIGDKAECVGFSEIDKYAIATYQSHFPEHKNYGDITKINEQELPDFDMLVGGFPCQAFSIAGKRKGFEDTRGTLFFDIARIIKAKQPRLVFLENVKGLLSHDNGETFRTIIATLDELGYDLQWQVLNSKNFGVPQNRERVFIVGHLRGTSRPEVFPLEPSNGTNAVEINILAHKDKYRRANQVYARNAITETLSTCGGGGQHPCTLQPVEENAMVRRLTPLECERLQGFPDNWTSICSDTQRYKQCGNAVTVNVIQAITEKLLTPPTLSPER